MATRITISNLGETTVSLKPRVKVPGLADALRRALVGLGSSIKVPEMAGTSPIQDLDARLNAPVWKGIYDRQQPEVDDPGVRGPAVEDNPARIAHETWQSVLLYLEDVQAEAESTGTEAQFWYSEGGSGKSRFIEALNTRNTLISPIVGIPGYAGFLEDLPAPPVQRATWKTETDAWLRERLMFVGIGAGILFALSGLAMLLVGLIGLDPLLPFGPLFLGLSALALGALWANRAARIVNPAYLLVLFIAPLFLAIEALLLGTY